MSVNTEDDMPTFQIHTHQGRHSTLVEMTAADLDEVGRRLTRDRFLVGRLMPPDDAGEPLDVLIPAHVVTCVAIHP